jgi:hypothetical protein
MGTAGSSKGSGSRTPLVPTWLDDPPIGPSPSPVPPPPTDNPDGDGQAQPNHDGSRPSIPLPPEPERFRTARGNFSAFARSGGNDRRALQRAVRDYVRSGTRGTGNAVRRMGSSRAAAGGVLNILGGFQRDGVQQTLLRLNLGQLVGRSTSDVLVGLTDVICRDGGPIDEAAARDAWLETVVELQDFGIDDLNALTAEQVTEVFQAFVTHAVVIRLFQEIGVNGFKVADLSAVEAFESQLFSYIERSIRDSFASDLSQLPSLTEQQIATVVDRTYRDAWDLLVAWGDTQV